MQYYPSSIIGNVVANDNMVFHRLLIKAHPFRRQQQLHCTHKNNKLLIDATFEWFVKQCHACGVVNSVHANEKHGMKGVCVFVHMLSALESGQAKRLGMLQTSYICPIMLHSQEPSCTAPPNAALLVSKAEVLQVCVYA